MLLAPHGFGNALALQKSISPGAETRGVTALEHTVAGAANLAPTEHAPLRALAFHLRETKAG